jgi:soluble lytic murein transglycosylase-like protein
MKKRILLTCMLIITVFLSSWLTRDCLTITNFTRLPESVKMAYYIEKYSIEYKIPRNIAYGVPYYETNYRGATDTTYNPKRTSKHNAYGAMQIKLATANGLSDTLITKKELLNNTELNVILSFKLLKILHNKYGNWKLAVGAYNTGKPIINKYSKLVCKFDIKRIVNPDNTILYAVKD